MIRQALGGLAALTVVACAAFAAQATTGQSVLPAHVIRQVVLRQIAILNYINPF
jgi:hypothetical protein